MELTNRDKRDSYNYDPKIKGFDTSFWSQVAGTTTVSSGNLSLNAASMASYGLHEFVEMLEMNITVPNAPTGGQAVRQFGFLSPASNNLGGIYFQTSGANFTAQIYDEFGNNSNATLVWSAGYTATATRFQIMWEPERILFKINDVIVANFYGPTLTPPAAIPTGALPLWIDNAASDAMLVTYIKVHRAAGIV